MVSYQYIAVIFGSAFGTIVIILLNQILENLKRLNKAMSEKGEIISAHEVALIDHEKRIFTVEKAQTDLLKEHYTNVGKCRTA